MIIGIDANEANVTKRLGVGEYAYQLLKQFHGLGIKNHELRFHIYLKNKPLHDLPSESENWIYIVCGPTKAWTQLGLPLQLYFSRNRPDVFFTPTHYAPRWSPVPTVVLILDLAYLFYPELFRKQDLYKLEKWTKYSVKNASAILTISDSSKSDIMKQYKISEAKIAVIYPGIKEILDSSHHKPNMDLLKEKYHIQGNFILFVGTLQPRKNIERLIEAFALFLGKNKKENISLVIIGKKGWQYEDILSAPERFHVTEAVKFMDFVPDEDLPLFYKHALFFALVSLYEGFGLPVLEAMKYGCPVLTSNISSLPEAGGDAALYCDPKDTNDIANHIEKLAHDKNLRAELTKKGEQQIKKFSWETAARDTLKVLMSVANKK